MRRKGWRQKNISNDEERRKDIVISKWHTEHLHEIIRDLHFLEHELDQIVNNFSTTLIVTLSFSVLWPGKESWTRWKQWQSGHKSKDPEDERRFFIDTFFDALRYEFSFSTVHDNRSWYNKVNSSYSRSNTRDEYTNAASWHKTDPSLSTDAPWSLDTIHLVMRSMSSFVFWKELSLESVTRVYAPHYKKQSSVPFKLTYHSDSALN